MSSGPPFAGRPVSRISFRSGYDATSEEKSGRRAPRPGPAVDRLHLGDDDAAAMIAADRCLHRVAAAQAVLPDEMRRHVRVARRSGGSCSRRVGRTRRRATTSNQPSASPSATMTAGTGCARCVFGTRTAPAAAASASSVLAEAVASALMVRMRARMSRGRRAWRRHVLDRGPRRRGLWDVGARSAIVCRAAVVFRRRRHVVAVGIHFHVIGLEGGTRLRWARAAPPTGRASAFVHATECVVVNSRRTRPCGA